jgi:hypothetical protein
MSTAVQMDKFDDDDQKGGGCCSGLKAAQEDNMIVNRKRGLCYYFPFTDPLIGILFWGVFIGMIYVFGYACNDGNINRILYGTDWAGDACGDSDFDTEHLQHQYWPNPLYYESMGSVCMDNCPGVVEESDYASSAHYGSATPAPTAVSADHVSKQVVCTCNAQLAWNRTDPAGAAFAAGTGPLAQACNGATGAQTVQGAAYYKGHNWVRFDDESLFGTCTWNGLPSGITFSSADNLGCFLPAGTYGVSALMGTPGYFTSVDINGASTGAMGKYAVPICMNQYQTTEVFSRCIPQVSEETYSQFCSGGASVCPDISEYNGYMNSFAEVGGQVLGDLGTCMYVIMGSFGIAILMGFAYVFFMEKCACFVVWMVILISIFMTGLITLALGLFGQQCQDRVDATPQLATYDTDKRNMYVAYVFAGIFAVLWLVITCTALCFCKKINQAATLISLASDAFLDFPYLIFYPAVQILGLFALVSLWLFGSAMLASAGTQETNAIYGYHSWAFKDELKGMGVYWLFGFLWIAELMSACGFMIVGFCFAIWFFSEEVVEVGEKGGMCSICCGSRREPTRAVPSWVLMKSLKFTYTNHFGTVAFGSLIMAIIDLIRIIVEYIDAKKKEMEKAAGADGYVAGCIDKCWDYIFCCLRSCLWCLDCCMRFLNQNAYIQTIINGTSLCTSACRAITVMFDQLALFAIMTGIQQAVFAFGKLAISCSTAGICGLIITYAYKNEVTSIVLPVFVCLLVGYGISTAFMCIFDMGIDTMLMCYCEAAHGDAKREDGRAYHIPHELDKKMGEAREDMGKDELPSASGLSEGSDIKNLE